MQNKLKKIIIWRVAAITVIVIEVIVPVAIIDNNTMPGPRRSLHCRSLPSLLSQCFLRRHWRCLHRPTAAASAINVFSVSAAAATYQPLWSWPVAPQKSILVKILLNRKSILVKRHASMARRREHLSAYLRICVSGQQQNHKKIKKNQERIIRHRLKKMFLWVLIRICVSVYFLKKSQPQAS